jgi:hypothetical protein
MDRRAIIAAEKAKLAALTTNAGVVPAQAIRPPASEAPMICTSRPLDQATELAARRSCSSSRAGMTACNAGLKRVAPTASRAARR